LNYELAISEVGRVLHLATAAVGLQFFGKRTIAGKIESINPTIFGHEQ